MAAPSGAILRLRVELVCIKMDLSVLKTTLGLFKKFKKKTIIQTSEAPRFLFGVWFTNKPRLLQGIE